MGNTDVRDDVMSPSVAQIGIHDPYQNSPVSSF